MILLLFLVFSSASCELWSKGIVHYTINKKDYDPHSQDVILAAIAKIEKEICIKFFSTPAYSNSTDYEKLLNIANPDKQKDCPSVFDYSGTVVDMPIGYKCMDASSLAQSFAEMLRQSVGHDDASPKSLQPNAPKTISMTFRRNKGVPKDGSNLLSASDRNFINKAYQNECGSLNAKPREILRRAGGSILLSDNSMAYYAGLLWPYGVVMYGRGNDTKDSDFNKIRKAMSVIEASTCVVFQFVSNVDKLIARNFLWFSDLVEEYPNLGFTRNNQTISLHLMTHGAGGHTAHALNMLMRVLGIPMMSNRYDRDNYVTVNWRYVEKSKEHFLERLPEHAWLKNEQNEGMPYDFESVTHAPANFMCRDCSLGEQTVQPIQDHMWQRSLSMGHRTTLSESDIETLNMLYNGECNKKAK